MCQFASFFHNPLNGDVVIHDLNSHENTEKKLKLNLNIWKEGHYTPDGKFALRLTDADRIDKVECEERFKNRFPTFISFLNWAFKQESYKNGWLNLSGLTSTKDLVLPKEIGGWLYLSGLTSAKDLVLPKEIGGSLSLSGLTSAKDLVLPKEIGDSLDLSGLTSAKDLVLPKEIGGSLSLSGLTSTKDLVLPKEIGGWLNLRGKSFSSLKAAQEYIKKVR